MFFPLLSLLSFCAFSAAEDAEAGGIPLLNGNGGLTGAGYGDAYGGKVAEDVYGIGGRAGGQLGLTGLLGLGGGRKKRQDFGFVPFASLIQVDPVPPTEDATPAPVDEGRKKRDATATADASATADGGDASATANAAANPPPAVAAAAARKKRQASASANANATSNGGDASAVASAIANSRKGRRTTAAPAARKRRQASARV